MANELTTAAVSSCFWRHEWSKWEHYRVEGEKFGADDKYHECIVTKQRRVCLRCNKLEVEHVSG